MPCCALTAAAAASIESQGVVAHQKQSPIDGLVADQVRMGHADRHVGSSSGVKVVDVLARETAGPQDQRTRPREMLYAR